MISHLNNSTFLKHSPLLKSAHSILDNQPPREVLPKIGVDPESMNDHMFKFLDQLIRFEMMEAFISAIQTVISLDSPFEPERKGFSKIT